MPRPRLYFADFNSRERSHMRYITRLTRAGRPHPSKRANWLHFCQKCGKNISDSPKGTRICGECL